MVSEQLMQIVRDEFAMHLHGIHGESHWARVYENGLQLAERTGADTMVVELFAYLHDVKRMNDGWDPEHGSRAADFVASLPPSLLSVSDEQLDSLVYACTYHSDGLTEASITVQTCWDADRLDLGRVHIKPKPERLCTTAAQDPEMIEWAFCRSQVWS